jgi:hypothetical protein
LGISDWGFRIGLWELELGKQGAAAGGYWNVLFGLSKGQGFGLAESNATLRNEGGSINNFGEK